MKFTSYISCIFCVSALISSCCTKSKCLQQYPCETIEVKQKKYILNSRIFSGHIYMAQSTNSQNSIAMISLNLADDLAQEDFQPIILHEEIIPRNMVGQKVCFKLKSKNGVIYTDGLIDCPEPTQTIQRIDLSELDSFKIIDLHNTIDGSDHDPKGKSAAHVTGHIWEYRVNPRSKRNILSDSLQERYGFLRVCLNNLEDGCTENDILYYINAQLYDKEISLISDHSKSIHAKIDTANIKGTEILKIIKVSDRHVH